MRPVDYYKILGVAPDAAQDDIHRAFRELAKQHHPDRNPNDLAAATRFKQVAAAYAILSDRQTRSRYDSDLRILNAVFTRPTPAPAEPRPAAAAPKRASHLTVPCPNVSCRKRLRVARERLGEPIRCPICGARFHVDAATGQPRPVGRADREAESRSEALCAFEMGTTPVMISRTWLQVGRETMRLDHAIGIRYGVYRGPLGFVPLGRSYAAWLTDGQRMFQIECARGRGAWPLSRAAIRERYGGLVAALRETAQAHLVGQMLEALDEGRGFVVGDLFCDGYGIHRFGGLGWLRRAILKAVSWLSGRRRAEQFQLRATHLPWDELGSYKVVDERVMLYDRAKVKWAQFHLRDVWNGVCLPPLLKTLSQG